MLMENVPAAQAEPVKIGVLRIISAGPVFIALDKGFFAAEGLDPKLVIFDNAVPMAMGATAGDIDFGVSALSGALYNLAAHDALRIIAASAREAPGFQATAYVVANRAFAAGLRSLKDLPGHSVSVPVFGSPPHYSMALLAEKYGYSLESVRLVTLGSIANQVSGLIGGQTDAGLIQPPRSCRLSRARRPCSWASSAMRPHSSSARSTPRRARPTIGALPWRNSCALTARALRPITPPSSAPMSAAKTARPRQRRSPSSRAILANHRSRSSARFPIWMRMRGSTSTTCCTSSPGTTRRSC